MKKFIIFIPLVLSALSMASCSCSPAEGPQPDEITIEKTKMNYTYNDYIDNYYMTSSAIPNQGEPQILILPVYFSDSEIFISAAKKEVVRSDIEKCFAGAKEDVGFESVTSYYSTLSSNKCNLKCKVAEWINIDDSYATYARNEETTLTLVQKLTNDYFEKSGEDRTKYDLDKNGFLDGVVVIYAAPDYQSLDQKSYSNLWAYTTWDIYGTSNVDSPVLCNYFWASYDFMYSDDTARSKLGNNYGGGDTSGGKSILDTHIFIHEMGHMFGLADYYDYSYQYSPAGGFSMQDYNIASHDPFSAMALGWCDPYIPTESCTITLNTFQSSREVILLTNTWNDINSPFDEYLLVEFYSPDGLNQFDHENQYFATNRNQRRPVGPDEKGIRLWHVDARLLANPYRKDISNITVDPKASGKVQHLMSNTYYGKNGRNFISPMGQDYANYNILQLIRNEETETYRTKNAFDKYSMFKDGSKFSMNAFSKQFVNKARLNSNKVLGWNFEVRIEGDQAKISLTKTI